MKLAIILAAIGFVGTLLSLGAYVIFPIAITIDSLWPFIIGVGFFILFAFMMHRIRKELDRKRKRRPPP